jgi:hypothetical protein
MKPRAEAASRKTARRSTEQSKDRSDRRPIAEYDAVQSPGEAAVCRTGTELWDISSLRQQRKRAKKRD